jgi:signal transduction histidine kinase
MRALCVFVPLATGLLMQGRLPERRFARLLVGAALLTFVASLAGSDDELLYSAGRVAAWLAELALIYLILAFPSGRLRHPADRALVGLVAAVVAVLFLPTALVSDRYPVPSTWSACTTDCPANAFQVLRHAPAWVDGVVIPLRESLLSLLLLAVTVRLLARIAVATTPLRRTLAPVLTGAAFHAAALPLAFALRRASGASPFALTLAWILAAGLPVVAVGFVVGTARWRIVIGDRLYRLAPRLQGNRDPGSVRDIVAETLEDPTVQLVRRNGADRWTDMAGGPAPARVNADGHVSTVISRTDGEVAAIVHDEALNEQRPFVEAVGSLAMIALTNHRLEAQVEASLEEVSRSRQRILAVADEERRGIERDLHDGAQQRLVALRIKLELASELAADRHPPDAEQLRQLSRDAGDALDEVRSLAAGVYPALLVECGIDEALRSVARRSAVRTSIAGDNLGRYSPQIEAAVYFCCVEALQNAAKHAEARSISISVSDGDVLRFEVRDDGRGFDAHTPDGGHGLTNIRDRLLAVGGDLVVQSAPGEGTRIAARIPHAARR